MGLPVVAQRVISFNNFYVIIIFIDSVMCCFIVGDMKSDVDESTDSPFVTKFLKHHC